MPRGNFIEISDIQKYRGVTYDRAQRIKQIIRATLGIKRKRITIDEFADYEEINPQKLLQVLGVTALQQNIF